jgi:hypothetical protein
MKSIGLGSIWVPNMFQAEQNPFVFGFVHISWSKDALPEFTCYITFIMPKFLLLVPIQLWRNKGVPRFENNFHYLE